MDFSFGLPKVSAAMIGQAITDTVQDIVETKEAGSEQSEEIPAVESSSQGDLPPVRGVLT